MKRAGGDAILFAAALTVRVAHLAVLRDTPITKHLLIDSKFYDEFARRIASGGGLPDGVFFMNVLYGFFLGLAYEIAGPDGGRSLALVVQCVLGAASCVLLVKLGRVVERPREGLAAGILLAVYGPAIFYDAALLTPSLLLFLTTLATLVAVRGSAAGRTRAAVLGVLGGLLILGRANHVLLFPGWIASILRGRSAIARVAVLGLAALVVVFPVSLHNWKASGEIVPVTANGGMALWAGNHEGATGIYSEPTFLTNPVPEREAEDYRLEASRRAGRELTLAQSSAFWSWETLRRWGWAGDPAAALRLALRKARIFFHAVESQTNLSYYFAMDHSIVLRVFRVHFGWILPFAIVGMAFEGRRLPLVLLPIAVALVTCVLFYVSSEYRHPTVPCFLLFAAIGARALARAARAGAAPAAASAALLVALLVFANAPDPLLDRLTTRRADNLNFATLSLESGDARGAEMLARKSIAIDPAWAPSRRKLADVLARQGRMDEAAVEARFAERLEGKEDATSEEMRRAQELFSSGRFEEARAHFLEIAARGGPVRAQALNNAALAAAEAGRPAEADSLLVAATLADSTYSSPWVHRGRLALARGDTTAARRFAERALSLAPEDARALRLLERARGNALAPKIRPGS